MKPQYFLLLSSPGAEKVQFAHQLCSKEQYEYISVVNLMLVASAKAMIPNSQMDEETRTIYLDLFQMVQHRQEIPGNMMAWLINQKISEDPSKTYIIDGFPHTSDELDDLFAIDAHCKGAIYLQLRDSEIKEKLLQEKVLNNNQKINDAYISKYITNFHASFDPILSQFRVTGKLITLDPRKSIDELVSLADQEITRINEEADSEYEEDVE